MHGIANRTRKALRPFSRQELKVKSSKPISSRGEMRSSNKRKELKTSGGVVKHPIYIYQKMLLQRNLTLLGEWLSILYISKKVVAKELNTSGEVVKHPIYIKKVVAKELMVKHPINIKKVVRKELNTSRGVVKHPISENDCLDRFHHFGKMYNCHILPYVIQVYNFRRSIGLFTFKKELTLQDV